MTKCKACVEGPKGLEGHAELFVHKMSGGPMQFKCRACGSLWMRRQNGVQVEWTDAVGNEAGATIPQSANSRE